MAERCFSGEQGMKILMWLSIGLDRRSPSEHLLTEIVKTLHAQGHYVHILQKATGGNKPELPEEMAACGVTSTCIPCSVAGKSNFVSRYLTDLKYVCACCEALRRERYDRIFLQSSNVAGVQMHILSHWQPQVPVIFNVQDIFPENAVYSGKLCGNGLKYKFLSAEQKYAYARAGQIITISEDMRDQLLTLGVPRERISVIYNWSYQDGAYDPEKLDCTLVREMLPVDKFNVVYAGNIGLMQNVDTILSAAEQTLDHDEILYHIIGDGLYKKKLKKAAEERKLSNVVFAEMLPSELAPSLYCTADVNVIPLAKDIYKTALPSKTATCLACGKPVIFCLGKESQFAQRMAKEAGCVVLDSDRSDELAAAIVKLARNRAAGVCNTEVLELFSASRNSRSYAEIITQ